MQKNDKKCKWEARVDIGDVRLYVVPDILERNCDVVTFIFQKIILLENILGSGFNIK